MAENSLKKGRYTKYSNKIGLFSNNKGSFIKNDTEVVLNFPFKDTVLEAGMSKEDKGREERFLQIDIDSKDIDTLEEPKVLTDFRYVDKDGESSLTANSDFSFFDENGELKQNLLIKGNNLLALYTLKSRLAGRVKMIYIDPPYNTGGDGFRYNDNFNHSAWLTFMKNRLETARELLSDEGVIFVQCDDNEQAYLKVLMDEIFGRDNFVNTIIPVMNPRGRQEASYPIAKSHEYITVFSKVKTNATLYQVDKKSVSEDTGDKFRLLGLRKSGNASRREDRPNMFYAIYFDEATGSISTTRQSEDAHEIYPIKTNDGSEGRWRWSRGNVDANSELLVAKRNSKGDYDIYVKDYLSKDGEQKGTKLNTFIKDVTIINDKAKQHIEQLFGREMFDYPKSEYLLAKLLEFATAEGDIVLDFCLGSGTTSAVAHKMGRRWVGIEQMDYIEEVAKERLKKVVAGEQGGISKTVDWSGGGSFVYFELKKYNQEYIDRIMEATSLKELEDIYVEIRNNAFLKFWFDRSQFEKDEDFRQLDLDGRKEVLADVLDENQLYLNYADMDDTRHEVTADEKALTDKFYGTNEN